MKNFFKDKNWDDYYLMATLVIIIIGFVLFFIGFFFGFDIDVAIVGQQLHTNVRNVISGDSKVVEAFIGDNPRNLFDLIGMIDSDMAPLYGFAVTAVVGFSFIMLSIAMIVLVIIVGLIIELVQKKKNKKA